MGSGFHTLPRKKALALSAKGGRASHRLGTGHEWTPEEARIAGSKGGRAPRSSVLREKLAHKLDWATVRAIRAMWDGDATTMIKDVAAAFGLSSAMVSAIMRNEKWPIEFDPAYTPPRDRQDQARAPSPQRKRKEPQRRRSLAR